MVLTAYAQTPGERSVHNIQSRETEDERIVVTGVIERAEAHFRQGELNLIEHEIRTARAEFDKAIDTVLESGLDVRKLPRLETYYRQLIARIYGIEKTLADKTRLNPRSPGLLREQRFEPSPLDDLSKLDLSKFTPTKPPAWCAAIKLTDIQIRGFSLGMGVAEVRQRLPWLSVRPADAYGLGTGSATIPGRLQASQTSGFYGVRALAFSFLDGRVSYIGVAYDDSIRWVSLDEFARRTAEALKLPISWEAVTEDYRPRRQITCLGFTLTVEFRDSYSLNRPILRLTGTNALDLYAQRQAAAEERRRQEEEKRRRTFKP